MAIAGLSAAMGILLSAEKKKKMAVFSELYEFNEQLLINLKYSKQTLDKVAKNFKYMPLILSGEKVLGGEEEEIIEEYIVNLGKSDSLSQIDYLNEKKPSLLKHKTQTAEDYKKYSSLYIKIFFMIGILIAVLLA